MGFVRFDFSKKYPEAFFVSILIAEEYQGFGMASKGLTLAIHRIQQEFGVHSIYADVHVSNIASMNLFKKCGFKFILTEDNFSTFQLLVKRT